MKALNATTVQWFLWFSLCFTHNFFKEEQVTCEFQLSSSSSPILSCVTPASRPLPGCPWSSSANTSADIDRISRLLTILPLYYLPWLCISLTSESMQCPQGLVSHQAVKQFKTKTETKESAFLAPFLHKQVVLLFLWGCFWTLNLHLVLHNTQWSSFINKWVLFSRLPFRSCPALPVYLKNISPITMLEPCTESTRTKLNCSAVFCRMRHPPYSSKNNPKQAKQPPEEMRASQEILVSVKECWKAADLFRGSEARPAEAVPVNEAWV